MDEIWQQKQEQENESGIDMHDCWHHNHPLKADELRRTETWHDKNHRLLEGFDKVRPIIKGEVNGKTGNNNSTKTPF